MRTRAIILALTMLLLAAAPAMASGQWNEELPHQLGKCQKLPPTYEKGGIPQLVAYFHLGTGSSYMIEYQDGAHFNLSESLMGGPSVPIGSSIPLKQVEQIIESKCSK